MKYFLACMIIASLANPAWAASAKPYPLLVRKVFIKGCVEDDASMQSYCDCLLSELEKTMDYKEFIATSELSEEEMMNNPQFANAVVACVDKVQ